MGSTRPEPVRSVTVPRFTLTLTLTRSKPDKADNDMIKGRGVQSEEDDDERYSNNNSDP